MITVYAETKGYAEQIAIFEDEHIYLQCLPVLEAWATSNNFDKITESES